MAAFRAVGHRIPAARAMACFLQKGPVVSDFSNPQNRRPLSVKHHERGSVRESPAGYETCF